MWSQSKSLVNIQYKTSSQQLLQLFLKFCIIRCWFFFFCISFTTFCIWFDAPLTSFVYISHRLIYTERGQVKTERNSSWRLPCRLSRLLSGSPQKFMPHKPERSSAPTKRARLDLTHRRSASSTLLPCWQLRGFVLLTVAKFVSLSHRWYDQGGQKEDSEYIVCLFTAIFTAIVYAYHICHFQVDLNVEHTCFKHTSLTRLFYFH